MISRSKVNSILGDYKALAQDTSSHWIDRKKAHAICGALEGLLEEPNEKRSEAANLGRIYDVLKGVINFRYGTPYLTDYKDDFALDVMALCLAHTFEGANKFLWIVRDSGTHLYRIPYERSITPDFINRFRKGEYGSVLIFTVDLVAGTLVWENPNGNDKTLKTYEEGMIFMADIHHEYKNNQTVISSVKTKSKEKV